MSKFSFKKLIALVMALVLVMSITAVGSSAEQKPAPLFTISDIETRQGEEVDVTIKFAQDIKPGGTNISALDVSLKYSSEVFEVVQIAKGDGLIAAFDKLSNSTKLHLETGDYIFGSSAKVPGYVNWSLSTLDGFTFAKDSVFAVVTFKAKDFSNLEGDFDMTLEVTNAADKIDTANYKDTTALYTPVTNSVKVDVNLATLCDWEDFNTEKNTCTLAKLNDKNATYFTVPDVYDPDNEGPLPAYKVTKIKYGAFSTTSKLQTVVLGENIKTIDSGAFFNCTGLKKVTIYSDDVQFGSLAFLGSKTNLVIRCKQGSSADAFAKKDGIKVEYFEEISGCNFTGLEDKKYNGAPITLADIKIYNSYKVLLKEGKDYYLEYSDNTDIGKATIRATGIGEYWGTYDLHFNIICPYHDKEELEDEETQYYTEKIVYDEHDCTKGGKLIKDCAFCGMHEESELPAKDHADFEWIITKDPTCQEAGVKSHICKDCSLVDATEEIPIIPCDMQWVTITEPTCKEMGLKQYQCTMCGKTEGDPVVINKLSHDDEGVCEWITNREVTCLKDGEEWLVCKHCGSCVDTRTIPSAGSHLESADWVIAKEATCTEDGLKQKVCVNCGTKIIDEVIPAKGHKEAAEKVIIEATCTKDGSEQTVCADCGEVIATKVLQHTGHEKSDWKVITAETCTSDGLEGIECAKCHEIFESKPIPSPGHVPTNDYVPIIPVTCETDGEEGIVCKYCGTSHIFSRREVKATGHNYSSWVSAVAPTCTSEGFEQRTCANCGDVEVRVVKATGHNPQFVADILPTYKLTGREKKICVNCGLDYHETRVAAKVVPDLDGNGRVASADALMILQHATGLVTLEGKPLKNADCDGNGKVNSSDALIVLQLATGIISAD